MRTLPFATSLCLIALFSIQQSDAQTDRFSVDAFGHAQKMYGRGGVIEQGATEHEFLKHLLNELSKRNDFYLGGDFSTQEFTRLEAHFYSFSSTKKHTLPEIKAALAVLTAGCGLTRSIRENYTGAARPGQAGAKPDTDFTDSYSFWGCTNPTIDAINKAGIASIHYDESSLDSATLSFRVRDGSLLPMNSVLTKLRAINDPNLQILASELEPVTIIHMGGTPNLVIKALKPSQGLRSPLEITHVFGWGDCPAGCIYNHTSKFEATPIPEASRSKGVQRDWFTWKLISESGSPLPGPGEPLY